ALPILLAAAEAAQEAAAADAAGALAAQARLLRADRESALLQRANADAAHPGAPSLVIARLGALLPPSAFVQHLEWDGRQWKIDGSAIDAAGLVPRLDAVPVFEQVRSLAPSTRFLDGGTPRSSFSIGFAVRGGARDSTAAPGGTRGQR
ncbi:MAG: PilN domain-containing protein, partial [Gemmatimonadaceae bacterium]|nr:PilN domain-containing protein [Gemmatimonadaceae bacterium]